MDQEYTAEWAAAVSKLAELARQKDRFPESDHLRQIEESWGREAMKQAAAEVGITWDHARQASWVSKNFPPGHPLRQNRLTYSHLRLLPNIEDPEKWGSMAVQNNWKVKQLKEEISQASGKKVLGEGAASQAGPEEHSPHGAGTASCRARSAEGSFKIEEWEILPAHPAADIFPQLKGEEYEQLCQDIAENGLIDTIWVCQDQILDGRNRHRACRDMGVEPLFREYRGADPLGHVVSLNVRRRHLDESQRAMVAAKIASLKKGQRADTSIDVSAVTQPAAAKLLNVSLPSVQRATKVQEKGIDEVSAAVEMGEMSVSAAAELVELPKEQQKDLLTTLRQEDGAKITAALIGKAKRGSQGAISATSDGETIPRRSPNPGGPEGPPHHHPRQGDNLDLVAQELAACYSPEEWYKINDRVLQLYDLKDPNSLKAA